MIFYRWELTQQPIRQAKACDAYAHCATADTAQQSVRAFRSSLVSTVALVSSLPSARTSLISTAALVSSLPSAVVVTPTSASYVGGTGDLAVTVAAQAGTGLREIAVTLDGAPVNTFTYGASPLVTSTLKTFGLSNVTQGKHMLAVVATDQAGATQATPFIAEFVVDAAAPSVTLDQTVLNADDTIELGSGVMHLTGTATDTVGLAAVQVKINNGAFSDARFGNGVWAVSVPLGRNPEGKNFTFTIRAIDFAGQIKEVQRTLLVDIRKAGLPTTSFTAQPGEFVTAVNSVFELAGQAFNNATIAGFQCRLDDADWELCASSLALRTLTDGLHTLQARALDSQGYVDDTPVVAVWTVDTVPPETTLTGKPAAVSNTAAPQFTFTANEPGGSGVAGAECSLDGATFVDCEMKESQSYSDLADGAHTFKVRAYDRAGNRDPSPEVWSWTVDTTPPETTITTHPTQRTNSNAASFSFSGDDAGGMSVARLECKLDMGDWATCTSPHSYSKLADGSHTFRVRAYDTAGNMDLTPAEWSWTVDTTPPRVTILSGPAATTVSSNPVFTFTADDQGGTGVVSVECSLDGAAFAACETPKTQSYTKLADGTHTFRVRATDEVGNVTSSPATWTWVVDTVAPETTLTGKPPAASSSNNPVFTFTTADPGGSGVAGAECSLDGAAFTACKSLTSHSYTALGDGQHTFKVRAYDRAGNRDQSPESWSWLIDTTPPDTRITVQPAAYSPSATARFEFAGEDGTGSGVARLECRLDTGAWTTCSSPRNYTSLANGTHTFQVRAIDAAGNVDSTPAKATWVVDTVAPETTLTGKPPAASSSKNPVFTFTTADPGGSGVAGAECSLDGAAFTACKSLTSHSYTALGDGQHTFKVRAYDRAGNRDQSPESWSWLIDTTPPDTRITAKPLPLSNSDQARFEFAGEDGTGSGVARLECRLDTGAWATCGSPRAYRLLRNGQHTFQVRAIDRVGNVDSTPASFTWKIDTTLRFGIEKSWHIGKEKAEQEDILQIDGNNVVTQYFDGSDVGIKQVRVDAFTVLSDGSLLFSFDKTAKKVPGIAVDVEPADLVRFVPRSLGATTAGTWSLYFDGSDVGLTAKDANITGVQVQEGGALLMTLEGDTTILAGIAGPVDDSDIIRFVPRSLGATTAGTWSRFFDGSDVGLTTKDEALDGFSYDVDGRLLLSTRGMLAVTGLTAAREDVVIFAPTSLGDTTVGTYRPELFLDFSALGSTDQIQAIDLRK